MNNLKLNETGAVELLMQVVEQRGEALQTAVQYANTGGYLLPTGAVLVRMGDAYVIKGYHHSGQDLDPYRKYEGR